jgi:eukaryotic-like serine/threonine-protein kinase
MAGWWSRGALVAGVAAALASLPSTAAGDAATHQADAAHTGHASVPGLNPPLRRIWSKRFPDVVSYPVIASGRVFVTAMTEPHNGATRRSVLVALSLRSGRRLWRRELGLGVGGQLGYAEGRVFVTRGGYEEPAVEALAAADGRSLWRLAGDNFSSEPPVPAGGVVYVPLGGGITALRASDGQVLWRAAPNDGSPGTPAISDGRLFLTYPCENVFALRLDGSPLWSHLGPCHGGGGETAAVYRGRVFSREGDGDVDGRVYDAASGRALRTLESHEPPAFAGGLGFFPDARRPKEPLRMPHTLIARSVDTGRARWRFRGDGYLDGPPLVVNRTVYVGSGSGTLYGLSTRSGRVVWRDRLGTPLPATAQPWDMQPGMAAAEGVLVVPALRRLVAYR